MQRHQTCRYAQCPHNAKLILAHHTEIQYGTRHYMHADCYVRSGKPFSALTPFRAGTLPYFVVKETGRLPELEAVLA